MKVSNFTLLLILAIFMVVGAALLPKIDVADNPRPRQGKTLTVEFYWQRASAKVIEQNVTSRIEGLISAVKGVESVSSESYFGSGKVVVELKKEADVSSTKFEISSLLKQIHKRLPEGVSYPVLTGGEVVNEKGRSETTQLLLTYQINSNLSDEQLKEYIEKEVFPEYDKKLVFDQEEKIVDDEIEFIKNFRNVKAENKITKDMKVMFDTSDDNERIVKMLKLDKENIVDKPLGDKAYKVFSSRVKATIFFEKVESEAEKAAKETEIALLKASIKRRETLLANENYVNKAPEKIVNLDREKLKEEKKKLEELTK